jgi:hypothetical protein
MDRQGGGQTLTANQIDVNDWQRVGAVRANKSLAGCNMREDTFELIWAS